MASLVVSVASAVTGGGVLGTVLGVVGTAFSVLGSLQQGKAAQAQSNQQAQVARYNSQVAQNNAMQARRVAEVEAMEIRQETRRRIGMQMARAAAGGVVTTEGSPLLATLAQASQGELDAQKRLFQGETQAQGQEQQSALDSAQAQAFVSQGKSAMTSAYRSSALTAGRGISGVLTGTSLLR